MFERATRRYRKPAFGIDAVEIDGALVPMEIETALAKPFGDLLHFRRDTTRSDPKSCWWRRSPAITRRCCATRSNGPLPDHDVYITDWANAADVPLANGRFDLDDYIDHVVEIPDRPRPRHARHRGLSALGAGARRHLR